MTFSNSNQHYRIYVSTQKDYNPFESSLITLKCNVKLSYISDKPDRSIPSYIQGHESWHKFEHELTRDFLSNMLTDSGIIPFPLRNLHWKERVYDKESVPLISADEVITSILGKASETRCLLVFIKKQVIVPHDEYLLMLKAKQAEEIVHQVEDMVRAQALGHKFQQSDWEEMVDVIRRAELGNSIRRTLDLMRERATRLSREQQVRHG